MGGYTLLLQSWAWYHMPFIASRVPWPEITYPLAERLLEIVKSKFLISMMHIITLQ